MGDQNLKAHFARWTDWTRKAAREVGCSVAAFQEVERNASSDGQVWSARSPRSLRRRYDMLRRSGLVDDNGHNLHMFGYNLAQATLTPKGRQVVWMCALVGDEVVASWRAAVRADRVAAMTGGARG